MRIIRGTTTSHSGKETATVGTTRRRPPAHKFPARRSKEFKCRPIPLFLLPHTGEIEDRGMEIDILILLVRTFRVTDGDIFPFGQGILGGLLIPGEAAITLLVHLRLPLARQPQDIELCRCRGL